MYYCLRCKRVHGSGLVSKQHKVFASRAWKHKNTSSSFHIPMTTTIKVPKVRVSDFLPSHLGLSRSQKSRNLLKPMDIHERALASRIQEKSGMTHIQTMQIIRKSRDSDFDIEHGIDWGLSKDRKETFEFATEQLTVGINPLKKNLRDLIAGDSMYGF
jgi:hypothetical protein